MSDELDDELTRMLQHHLDQDGKTKLEGVNPPGASEAAAGTWQGDAPEGSTEVPDLLSQPEVPAARPSSVPAQVSAAVTTGAPKRKSDLSQPLGYRAPAAPKDTELADLQADAKKRRGESQLGQAVTDFTERPTNFLDYAQRLGGGGVSAPPQKNPAWKDHEAEGERAIADLDARRASDARAGAAQSSSAKAAEKKDPQSETAKTYRSILTKLAPNIAEQLEGASAEQMETMVPWLEKFAEQHAAELKAQALAAAKVKSDDEKKTQRAADQERNDKWRATVHADAQENAGAMRDLARGNFKLSKDKFDLEQEAKAKGHQTSTSTLTDLADAETAINELEPLGQKFKDLGMSSTESKLSSKATDLFDLQGTDAAEYKATALRAMQGVGKIMEGGKLAAGDEVKYRQMLPRPGDSEQIADQKIKESQAFLSKLKDERIKVLRAAGYNVPDVGSPQPVAPAKTTPAHGKVVFEGDRLREYEDGHIEEVE